MVELSTRKGEIRADGGNYHENLGLKRILCVSQCTIPIRACMSLDPACNDTNTRSSQLNLASRTPDFSYPLISSTAFSSSSPISLFVIHNLTIITNHKFMSSLSVSPHHDHQLTPSTAYTKYSIPRVENTPSTAYTEYSIHRVQHPPKIICLPFILIIRSWPLNVPSASSVPPYTIDRHQPAL